ncbi:MAG: THUMP domain-containing protein, partial [Candidatus Micrarchaeota archaeon]|nr:THUMP domain-containing protein [Candidatus Micrarchaeota archaeon]
MIIVKYVEPVLKSSGTRRNLEKMIVWAARDAVARAGLSAKIAKKGSVLFIETDDEGKCASAIRTVMGINHIYIAKEAESKFAEMERECVNVAKRIPENSSFAIRAKRFGNHDFTSEDVGVRCGAAVQKSKNLRVDLKKPDYEIFVDVRENRTFVSLGRITCAGGLPVGSEGRLVALVSGKNSQLAAWMMMRRGAEVVLVNAGRSAGTFAKLAKELERWHAGARLRVVEIESKKRNMKELLEIAGGFAETMGAEGIITGEGMGKRTFEFDSSISFPVYRP